MAYGDMPPVLAELSDCVLFGGVWQREGLSKRGRSLITVTSPVSLCRVDELSGHVKRALIRDELVTHVAF